MEEINQRENAPAMPPDNPVTMEINTSCSVTNFQIDIMGSATPS
jgi:hypothetical protein